MRHVLWTNAAPAGALAALAVCWAGCGAILGVDADATLASTGAGGHSSTTTGSGGQSTATGQGGAGGQGGTTTTSTGSGGVGGGGGSPACTPGDGGATGCKAGEYCDPGTKACIPGCEGTLRVRVTTDNSGTAQDIAKPYNQALADYFREVNANGGIRGCLIDFDIQDGKYDATATHNVVLAWNAKPEWPEVNAVFVFGTGPTKNIAIMDEMKGKIVIPGSYAGAFTSPNPLSITVDVPDVNGQGQMSTTPTPKNSPGYPYIFFPATDYSTGIRAGIHAAWSIGAGKMAMVYDTTCAYCTDPLAAGKSYILTLPGMDLAQDISNVPQTSDISQVTTISSAIKTAMVAEIAKFKADGNYHPVKWLWCGNSVTSCAGVAKGAGLANKEIAAQISDPAQRWTIRVMANNWGIGETSSTLCGAVGLSADCDDVLYGLFPVPRYGDTANATGMQPMMDLHDKWAKVDNYPGGLTTYEDVRFVQGYAAALMWRRAVEAALDDGHTKPTGDDLKEHLEKFNQVDLGGMTAGPISFTNSDHRPQGNESIYYLHQTQLTYQGPSSLALDTKWLGY